MRIECVINNVDPHFSGIRIYADDITLPDGFVSSWGNAMHWRYDGDNLGNLISYFLNSEPELFVSQCIPDIYKIKDSRVTSVEPSNLQYSLCISTLLDAITSEFFDFPMTYYKKAADKIFIDHMQNLTTRQKWFAFTRVYRAIDISHNVTPEIGFNYWPTDFHSAFCEEFVDLVMGSDDQSEDKRFVDLCELITNKRQEFEPLYRYNFYSFKDLFVFCFNEFIRSNGVLKKCEHCSRYFSPSRHGVRYCDMPAPEYPSKTCLEYVKYQKYLDRSHTEAVQLHKRIYNRKANKYKRTENTTLLADLNRFKTQSATWRNDVRNGRKTEQEYIEWLKAEKAKNN